jgi:hypothetical protein
MAKNKPATGGRRQNVFCLGIKSSQFDADGLFTSTVTMRLLGAFKSVSIYSSFAVDNTIIAVEIIHNSTNWAVLLG